MATKHWQAHLCVLCGYLYEDPPGVFTEAPENQLQWQALPDNWRCPDCGAKKSFFDEIELNIPMEDNEINL